MATTAPANGMSKVSKAKARMLMKHPFFACLLLRTQVTMDPSVPMAATDGERMYFNPDFLEKLSIDDTMTVMCHEVGHDSLLHSIRLGSRDHDRWNRACDHAINLMLEDQGFVCPKAVPGGWLADKKYKGWSADRVYDDLKREEAKQPQGGKGGGKPGTGPTANDWMHGDVKPQKGTGDPAEQARREQAAKQKVAAAANMARVAGKLSGDLERMVGECLETKIAWTDVLRDFMLQVVKEKENWSRQNRRFPDIYLPVRRSVRMGPIVFIPDTSGSMMGEDMEKICTEMSACAEQVHPSSIKVVWADAKVQSEQDFDMCDFEYAALKPKGGGGTDMRVPLAHVEQYDPSVVVLLTDCYTPWPDGEPPYPVIVISTTDLVAPIGTTIKI